MISRLVSDEVTDGIAAIELHRQGTEQESGLAVACSEALRKLQALLEQEKEALQLHGPDTVPEWHYRVKPAGGSVPRHGSG